MQETDKNTVRAVERALDVLTCFAEEPSGLGVSQIAERLGLYKSTVHRLLGTLETKGFVRRESDGGKYLLGIRTLELAGRYLAGRDLAGAAYPEMLRLRDLIDETISLYIRDGNDRVRVQAVESRQDVRRVVRVGQRLPLFLGASGKVLLAHCDTGEEREILAEDRLPAGFDLVRLLEQLETVRSSGFATSIGERETSAASVAVPVFNRSRVIVAALAASGPFGRFDEETMLRYANLLAQSAQVIGAGLP